MLLTLFRRPYRFFLLAAALALILCLFPIRAREPAQEGLEIELDSVVQNQFGDTILKTVQEVLKELDVQVAKLSIVDRGALDCVIRARVETAVLRGKGEC